MKEDYAIEMVDISKKFGATYALKNITLQVEKGTCHALVGENGAGKSTMMKILAGVLKRDTGKIFIGGEKTEIKSRAVSQKLGIAFVPQELNFISCFTVAENIFLGEEQKGKTNLIDFKKLYREADELLKKLKIELPLKAKAGDLNVSQQQMMIIARILSHDAKIIIMDEPTARLGHGEIKHLLEYIKYLKSIGKTIIFISHHLDEVFDVCDGVTVLRDGETITTKKISEVSSAELIRLMVNRDVDETLLPETGHRIGDVVLEVKNLSKKGVLSDVSFNVREGEILGFYGLVGAGRSEAIRAMLGIDRCDSIETYLKGEPVRFKNNRQAMKHGVVLVPEERRKQGLVLSLPIGQNVTMGQMSKYEVAGLINKKKEQQAIDDAIEKIGVVCSSSKQAVGELSGGNQQKVVIAKYINSDVSVFILDEPTRGVDIGAKKQIYDIIENLASKGIAVIVISSEIPELQLISDRVCIMKEGRIVKELSRAEILDANNALEAAMGESEKGA